MPTAILVFAGFFILPVGIRTMWARVSAPELKLRDTASLILAERQARKNLAIADSELARLRSVVDSSQVKSDRLSPGFGSPRSDTLISEIVVLDRLLRRASDAPLPESYRALAESAPLRADPHVRALRDSLLDVERDREEFGSGAAVDPLFVALTTRANSLGRAIVVAGGAKRQALWAELATERDAEVRPISDSLPSPDTLAAAVRRDRARQELRQSMQTLAEVVAANRATQSAADQARARQQLAPTTVLIAASTILSIAILFAVALGDEIRSPRVADGADAERMADTRVLSVVRPRIIPDDRMRRVADHLRPALLDPHLDAYRMLAWHVSAHAPRDGILVVTGDVPSNTATIAANIAAVLAMEARATLLLDIDFENALLSDVLRLPTAPGIAAVLENRRRWSETVAQVTVGRGRVVDCIPAGLRRRPLGPAEREALSGEIRRASRRYDFTIVHAPLHLARGVVPGGDAMLCATLAHTRLSSLARAAAGLRDDGARVIGVALWEGDDVHLRRGASQRRGSAKWAHRASELA